MKRSAVILLLILVPSLLSPAAAQHPTVQRIYWTEANVNDGVYRLMRSDPDGGNISLMPVFQLWDWSGASPQVDANCSYGRICLNTTQRIYSNTTSGNKKTIVYQRPAEYRSMSGGSTRIASYADHVYWYEVGTGTMNRVGIFDMQVDQLFETHDVYDFDIDVDLDEIFFSQEGQLRVAPLNGGSSQSIDTGSHGAVSVAVGFGSTIFFSDYSGIHRVNRDGSNLQTVYPCNQFQLGCTGIASQYTGGLEWDPREQHIYWNDQTGIWRLKISDRVPVLIYSQAEGTYVHSFSLLSGYENPRQTGGVNIVAPGELRRDEAGNLVPNPFRIKAIIEMGTNGTIARLQKAGASDFPDGIVLAAGETVEKPIGDTLPGTVTELSWMVSANDQVHGDIDFAVYVSGVGKSQAGAYSTRIPEPGGGWDDAVSKIYWANYSTGQIPGEWRIWRSDPDGSAIELIYSSTNSITALAIDSKRRRLHWTTNNDLYVSTLTGDDPHVLVEDSGINPRQILVDETNDKIYWLLHDTIMRANVDGTDAESFVPNLQWTKGMALDEGNGRIFWIEQPSGIPPAPRVSSIDLDGTGFTIVETDRLREPKGLAYDSPSQTLFILDSYSFLDEVKSRRILGSETLMEVFTPGEVGNSGTQVPRSHLILDSGSRQLYWMQHVREGTLLLDRIIRADFYGSEASEINVFTGLASENGPLALLFGGGRMAIGVSSTAPAELSRVDGQLTPNPFEIVAVAENAGDGPLTNVRLELELPAGLTLASGQDSVVVIPTLGPGLTQSVTWEVVAADNIQGSVGYTVSAISDEVDQVLTRGTIQVADLPVAGVFWLERETNGTVARLFKSDPDGSQVEEIGLVDPSSVPLPLAYRSGLSFDSNAERFTWGEADNLYSANLDGSDAAPAADSTGCSRVGGASECVVYDVATSSSGTYWTFEYASYSAGQGDYVSEVWHQPSSGGSETMILSKFVSRDRDFTRNVSIAIDEGDRAIYMAHGNASYVARADLTLPPDQQLTVLMDGTEVLMPRSIALDPEAGMMYFIDEFGGSGIKRARLDGSELNQIYSCSNCKPRDLVLDLEGGFIYWTDSVLDQVLRMDLSGSAVTVLAQRDVNGENDGPSSIALRYGVAGSGGGNGGGDGGGDGGGGDGVSLSVTLTISDTMAATETATAFNPSSSEYLVVWRGHSQNQFGLDDYEIYGRFIDATSGEVSGDDFPISQMGAQGDILWVNKPAVSYNRTDNEFLVVWSAERSFGEYEIFGQRVDAEQGVEIGEDDFRISVMGPDGDVTYDALEPALSYNIDDNEYLVAWVLRMNDDSGELGKVWGQRLGGSGSAVGDHFEISGPLKYLNHPDVAFNPSFDKYYFVFSGVTVLGEAGIFGLTVDADSGNIGGQAQYVEKFSDPFDTATWGREPAIVYNSVDDNYLLVWNDAVQPGIPGSPQEIFGTFLSGSSGLPIGEERIRISDMGAESDSQFEVADPDVSFDAANNEYLVVWTGDDSTNDEFEIWGQRLDSAGVEIGENDFRISEMGTDGDAAYDGLEPDVVYNGASGQYLIVWHGNHSDPIRTDVFGRFLEVEFNSEKTEFSHVDTTGTPVTHTVAPGGSTSDGFKTGTNSYGDQAKSTAHMMGSSKRSSSASLSEVRIWFTYKSANVTTETYLLEILSGNTTDGPRTVLYSHAFQMADITADDDLATEDPPMVYAFDPPISVTGGFFVSVDFGSYDAVQAANVSIGATETTGSRVGETWEKDSSGNWRNTSDAWFSGTDGVYLWMTATVTTTTGVNIEIDRLELPSSVSLMPNYPNPFNPRTTISFDMSMTAPTRLTVYDILGREVATLIEETLSRGRYNVTFDATNLVSGVYYYVLETPTTVETRSMVLLK